MNEPSGMDDDIDIEEHDVLDNPRIKSIFPDLSCVKIEIPDDDDDVVESQDDQMYEEENEPHISNYDSPHDTFYQHNFSFESLPMHLVTRSEHLQIQNDHNLAYDESDLDSLRYGSNSTPDQYSYSNEIILGSKPAVNYDLLYQEALESNPVVALEDWGQRLKNSTCFCQSCDILFPTVNALDAHKMINHSYLIALDYQRPNTARKSTNHANQSDGSKYCNHCDRIFVDDTALIKHLYEVLPQKVVPQPKKVIPTPKKVIATSIKVIPVPRKVVASSRNVALTPKPIDVKVTQYNIHKYENIKFKCLKCNEVFPKYDAARKHKRLHPGSYNKKIIIKIKSKIPKKVVDNEIDIKDKYNKGGKFYSNKIVPKAMFQCNKCRIHFLSCFAAVQHSIQCENTIAFQKCKTCKRKIRSRNVLMHTLQHKHVEKIKIYTLHKNIYDKVLCKCPYCNIYLEELVFWSHVKDQRCSAVQSKKCTECNILVSSNRYNTHILKHKQLKAKDFIIIEYKNLNAPTLKPKKIRKDASGRHILFYCDNCGCCQHKLLTKCHLENLCLDPKFRQRVCTLCGLRFTEKGYIAHRLRHEIENITLEKVSFINLQTELSMPPPIPTYSPCNTCKTYFVTPQLVKRHSCGKTISKICNICKKKYDLQSYKLHMAFHRARNEISIPENEIPVPELVKNEKYIPNNEIAIPELVNNEELPPINDIPIPELLKTYNSINNMWNIIYLCATCDLACISYDSAVEHCHNHINNVNDISEICETCEFDFLKDSYLSHEKLHANNRKINRDSFTVLQYDYKDLFRDCWFDILKQLPKQHKMLILSKSVYRYRRNIKMNVKGPVTVNDVRFYCLKCLKHVPYSSVQNHLVCTKSQYFTCVLCKSSLPDFVSLIRHEKRHDKTQKMYRIVTFNNEKDKVFNQNLITFENKCRSVEIATDLNVSNAKYMYMYNKLANKRVKVKMSRFKLFKCALCACCITYKFRTPVHSSCVTGGAERKFCTICKEYFAGNFFGHQKLHRRFPQLNKNCFTFIMFNENKGASTSGANEAVVEAVSDVEKADNTNKIAYVYKCQCGLHYTSRKTITKHIENECGRNIEISKEMCSKCNLEFPTDVLVTHLCNHHSKETTITIQHIKKIELIKCSECKLLFRGMSDFEPHPCSPVYGQKCKRCNITLGNKSYRRHVCDQNTVYVIDTEHGQIVPTLYKCTRCNLCYLNKKSFNYHIQQQHIVLTKIVPCNVCGFNFSMHSINKHMKAHQNKPTYVIKVIDTDSGEVTNLTGDNPPVPPRNSRKRRHSEMTKTEPLTDSDNDNELNDNENDFNENESLNQTDNDDTMSSTFDGNVTATSDITDKDVLSDGIKSILHLDTYNNSLFRCKKCNLHFLNSRSLYSHSVMRAHNDNPDVYTCDICDLDFSQKTLLRHKFIHHQIKKFRRDDFFIIDSTESETQLKSVKKYTRQRKSQHKIDEFDELSNTNDDNNDDDGVVEDTEALTRDVEPDTSLIQTPHVFKSDISLNRQLYKCIDCDIHFLHYDSLYSHVTHKNHGKKGGIMCDICGLRFTKITIHRHKLIHHNKMKLQLKDFVIDAIAAAEILTAKSKVVLYKCLHCDSHFLNRWTLASHKSRMLTNTTVPIVLKCQFCQLGFTRQSLEKHITLHHKDPNVNNFTIIDDEELNQSVIDVNQPNIDTNQPNIDTNQLNIDMNLSDIGINQSDIIKLNIDYPSTTELASTSFSDTFDQSDSESLTSNKNMQVSNRFKSICNKNKYTDELYKCLGCRLYFLHYDSLYSHMSRNSHGKVPEHKCKKCGLYFTPKSLTRHLYVHHQKMKLKLQDFKIKTVNPKVKKRPKYLEYSKNWVSKRMCLIPKTKHNVLFKCLACNIHFTSTGSMDMHLKNHNTNGNNAAVKCKYCQLNFSRWSFAVHIRLHCKLHTLTLKDLTIIDSDQFKCMSTEEKNSYNMTDDDVPKKVTVSNYSKRLYKCTDCNLHFLNYKSLHSHLGSRIHKAPGGNTSIHSCDTCGLTFLKRSFKTHQIIHHQKLNLQLKDLVIVVTDSEGKINRNHFNKTKALAYNVDVTYRPKKTPIVTTIRESNSKKRNHVLYKCTECSLHYLTKPSLSSHIVNHRRNKIPEPHTCDVCGLNFTEYSLPKHKNVHHRLRRLKLEDFTFETMFEDKIWDKSDPRATHNSQENKDQTNAKSELGVVNENQNRLFKCRQCRMHYLTERTLERHIIEYDHKVEPVYYKCNFCNLDFAIRSIKRHKLVHHIEKQLKLEDFVIVYLDSPSSSNSNEAKSLETSGILEEDTKSEYLEDGIDESQNLEESSQTSQDTELGEVQNLDDDCNMDIDGGQSVDENNQSTFDRQSDVVQGMVVDESSHLDETNNLDETNQIVDEIKEEVSNFDSNEQNLETINAKKIVYHKCAHCNVYFLNKNQCLEHCTDHKVIDTLMYINCKICDFQFLIECLKDHVILHHTTEFELKNVLVHEYTALDNLPPKIETYRAIDKVQSGLISTTTDTVV